MPYASWKSEAKEAVAGDRRGQGQLPRARNAWSRAEEGHQGDGQTEGIYTMDSFHSPFKSVNVFFLYQLRYMIYFTAQKWGKNATKIGVFFSSLNYYYNDISEAEMRSKESKKH